jgi:hypothetical protein
LDTDTGVSAALAILGAMPKRSAVASIEERAADMAEFGPSDLSMEEMGGRGSSTSIWSNAVQKANAALLAGTTAPASTTTINPKEPAP